MNDSFLDDMQNELVALCQADEVLGLVPILHERLGDINAEIEKSLGLVKQVSGKLGACVILQQPMADDRGSAAPGGLLQVVWTFLVLEDPLLNDSANGHQIRALKLCRRLVRVVKLYAAGGMATTMLADPKTIVPIANPIAPIAYQVTFRCTETSGGTMQKVIQPTIAPNGGVTPQLVTLSSGTAGAAIYYTLDGSHPWSGNPTAFLYAAPFNVNAAATLRARAFKAGYVGSDTTAADFT
jgi:hypothetical protein